MTKIQSAMIIDDNPGDILLTRKTLEATGLYQNVISTPSGEAALELFEDYDAARERHPEAFPPLVIFLDIKMPRMNGFEFLEKLHALNLETRAPTVIIMLSSSDLASDRERAAAFELVKDHTQKPLSREKAVEVAKLLQP